MEYFPASWGLVKRSAGPLLGYAAGRIVESYKAGQRAARAIDSESSSKFATWSERRPMAKSYMLKRRRPRRWGRRYRRRIYKTGDDGFRRIVRSSAPGVLTLPANTLFAAVYNGINLGVIVTSDLQSVYEFFRIRKVVLHLTPRIDPANSGITNNFQALIQCACDPSGVVTPLTSANQVSAYDNSYSKWVQSGQSYTYTFYPKAVNTVYNGSSASVASGGYGMNPWLMLDPTGVGIQHKELIVSASVPVASTVALNFDYYWDIHFDVKGFN